MSDSLILNSIRQEPRKIKMSETIGDLREENFRLKLRIYHLELERDQAEKTIESYKNEIRFVIVECKPTLQFLVRN